MQPPAYPPPPSPMGMGMAMDNGMGMGMHANGNMQTKARASRGRARRLQNTKRQHLQKLQNIAAKNTVQAEKHEKNCDKASTYVETLDKDAVSCHALGANCHNNTDCAWCNGRFCALSEYCTDPDVLYQLSLEKICGRSEKEIKRAQQETNKVEIQSRVNEEMKKKGIVD